MGAITVTKNEDPRFWDNSSSYFEDQKGSNEASHKCFKYSFKMMCGPFEGKNVHVLSHTDKYVIVHLYRIEDDNIFKWMNPLPIPIELS